MNYSKTILSLATSAFVATVLAGTAFANDCTTNYGGTTTCVPEDLSINKQVNNPKTNLFVENLGISEATYKAGEDVRFRLTVKNNSGETFKEVTVKDILPEYLTFVSGPGTYDSGSRIVTMKLENMTAGETRTIELLAKVEDRAKDKGSFCMTNTAQVHTQGRDDEDKADFCVGSPVLGTSTLPVAGFNDLLLVIPFVGTALGGIALLKKKA